jgi:hypothetical protein
VDAHGFARSSGNRILTVADLHEVPHQRIFRLFRQFSREHVYDFEHHVALSESLETCQGCKHIHLKSTHCDARLGDEISCPVCDGTVAVPIGSAAVCRCGEQRCACRGAGRLPVTFMLLQPQSWHPDVWSDITRMLSLNSTQAQRGQEMHLCPMQFDIADRVINQLSQPG